MQLQPRGALQTSERLQGMRYALVVTNDTIACHIFIIMIKSSDRQTAEACFDLVDVV